ncbi:MAG: hypothetical protein K1X65_01495 [Caldilineales bacterium]|nr:hypothetical protein [Caldilineales bacterium]MCW5857058.1 hypothetical protein [Caldilineales bacterium]
MKGKWISLMLALALVAVAFAAFPAPRVLAATKTWDGGAGTSNWSDASNWNDDVVPASTDSVVLDNSLLAGSYSVNLPGGAVTVAIVKLTISPAGVNTITLTLPSSNTNAPGFNVGDNTAATDDIVLDSGAILINSSGAGSGNGIQANSTSNGTVRINNGAKYVHNTARSTAGVIPLLSTASGTELGLFEYDVPGTSAFAISASGRTFGSLTLTRTAGAATYTASGGSALTIRGHFTLNTGITFNSTMTAALNLGGNLVNNGAALTFASSQAVNLNGTSAQSVSGSGAITFSSLSLNNAAGATLGRDVTVSTSLALTSGDITTGANTLTLAEAVTTSGNGDVWGNVKRTGTLVTTKTYSFGNPDVSLNFASGTVPTDVTVNIAQSQPSAFTYAVTRSYTITPNGGSGYAATVRLHYLESELNGNTESTLVLWRYDGSQWLNMGQSSRDSTNNWVEQSGITTFSPWAISSFTPTAVTLRSLAAHSPARPWAAALPLLGLMAVGGAALRRGRGR